MLQPESEPEHFVLGQEVSKWMKDWGNGCGAGTHGAVGRGERIPQRCLLVGMWGVRTTNERQPRRPFHCWAVKAVARHLRPSSLALRRQRGEKWLISTEGKSSWDEERAKARVEGCEFIFINEAEYADPTSIMRVPALMDSSVRPPSPCC